MPVCGHVGCDFSHESVSKVASHERSMNSHQQHFHNNKATCAKCVFMLQSGEWNDIEAIMIANGDSPEPIAAQPYAGEPDFVVDFMTCGHTGCTWTSHATRFSHREACVTYHEQCIKKHADHFQQCNGSCPCCQALLQANIWRIGADGGLENTLQARRKRRRGEDGGDVDDAVTASDGLDEGTHSDSHSDDVVEPKPKKRCIKKENQHQPNPKPTALKVKLEPVVKREPVDVMTQIRALCESRVVNTDTNQQLIALLSQCDPIMLADPALVALVAPMLAGPAMMVVS